MWEAIGGAVAMLSVVGGGFGWIISWHKANVRQLREDWTKDLLQAARLQRAEMLTELNGKYVRREELMLLQAQADKEHVEIWKQVEFLREWRHRAANEIAGLQGGRSNREL